MIYIYKSYNAKVLAAILSDTLKKKGIYSMQNAWIGAPDSIKYWLVRQLATNLGVFTGSLSSLRKIIQDVLELFDQIEQDYFTSDHLLFSVADGLKKMSDDDDFSLVKEYLDFDNSILRTLSLCQGISNIFADYLIYRPQLIKAFEDSSVKHELATETEHFSWQSKLFKHVSLQLGSKHDCTRIVNLINALRNKQAIEIFPGDIYIFGISSIPPLHLELLAALSKIIDIHLFLPVVTNEYIAESTKEDSINTLLQSFGKQAGVFQRQLIELGERYPIVEQEYLSHSYPVTILGAIQKGIRKNTNFNEVFIESFDDSLSFHACTSEQREIEVLKDNLLALFEEDDSLSSTDVLVMAPDIKVYAPFIQSVFSSVEDTFVPFCIQDLKFNGSFEVGTCLEQLLGLLSGKVTIGEVFDFLNKPLVRGKFNMQLEEVQDCYRVCKESNIRCYIDQEHRKNAKVAVFSENTWKFGLDRIALGYVIEDNGSLFDSVSPFDGVTHGKESYWGSFFEFMEIICEGVKKIEGVYTIEKWVDVLTSLALGLFDIEKIDDPQWQRIKNGLEQLRTIAQFVDFDEKLDVYSFKLLLKRVQNRASTGSYSGSGITFSSLKHLRGRTYKVICMLGLNEGDYPKGEMFFDFNLISVKPLSGDKDQRQDDGLIFLEAVLGAKDRLMLFYNGSGSDFANPPCIFYNELLNAAQASVVDTIKKEITPVFHPVKSYDPQYFTGDNPRLFNYSSDDYFAARAIAHLDSFCTEEENKEKDFNSAHNESISCVDLCSFWQRPISWFLKRVMGIEIPEVAPLPPDREPMELKELEGWKVGTKLLELMKNQPDGDDFFIQAKAQGSIPPGRLGELAFGEHFKTARLIFEEAFTRIGEKKKTKQAVNIDVETDFGLTSLVGELDNIYGDVQIDYSYSRMSESRLVRLWICHLIHCAVKEGQVIGTQIVARGDKNVKVAFFDSVSQPVAYLADLLGLFIIGQQTPLFFEPDISFDYVNKIEKNGDSFKKQYLEDAKDVFWDLHKEGDPVFSRALGSIDDFYSPVFGFERICQILVWPMLEHLTK